MDFKDIDEQGNSLIVENNIVTLKLKNQNFSVTLGIIHRKDGVYSLYKEEKENGKYRKTDSWSIPYNLLMKLDGTLNFRTEKGIYRIDVDHAKKYGSFLHFKQSGFEKKIYIPIAFWNFESH